MSKRMPARACPLRARRFLFALLASVFLPPGCDRAAPVPSAPAEAFDGRLMAAATAPELVISQVYGGGGNTNAPVTHDFVELFNPGTQQVDVSGWSVQ